MGRQYTCPDPTLREALIKERKKATITGYAHTIYTIFPFYMNIATVLLSYISTSVISNVSYERTE